MATKSIAFARVFGKGGQLLKHLLYEIRQKYDDLALKNNKLGIKATRDSATEHEVGLVLDSIAAYFGRYQLGMSNGKNFSTIKRKLSEAVVETICPIGKEIKKLLKDKSYLHGILEKGAKRADLIAKANLKEIYEIVGLAKYTC